MADKKKILLVDDNEPDNVYHEIILRRCNLVGEVIAMESSISAMQYLQQLTTTWPDVLFVDVNMPGMDGFAFIEQLQQLTLPNGTQFFMLTSSDAERDRQCAAQLKIVSGYIIKPLTTAIVLQLLAE